MILRGVLQVEKNSHNGIDYLGLSSGFGDLLDDQVLLKFFFGFKKGRIMMRKLNSGDPFRVGLTLHSGD